MTPLPHSPTAPRLTLQTLTRGDGLLGLRPTGLFGPRGSNVTVAMLDSDDPGAQERLAELGFHRLPADALQWRSVSALPAEQPLWSLLQEDFYGDFWAEQLPGLQQDGWRIVVRPGFAHESVTVDAWHLVVDPAGGEVLGKEVAAPLRGRARAISKLGGAATDSSWMLSLGIEVAGHTIDLVPLLANLLQRDKRWLHADQLALIDDAALIMLRAPGGKRIGAQAAPLKAIVSHMLDLLGDPRRKPGQLPLSAWDAWRLEALRQSLHDTQAERAGPQGLWQLQGEAGLHQLAERLRHTDGIAPVTAPSGLGVTLRPYQLHGVAWLQYLREQHLAGILADDMGLGKTAQALAHLLIEKQAGRLDCPALVVLPTSLLFNWQAEAARMAPDLRVLTLQGLERGADFSRMAQYDVVLTTYALVWRDLDRLRAQQFHLLILDEAQSVKNPASRSARAIRRLQARHRLCITGTPLENHLGELWTQFDFLLPGFLGDQRSFQRMWRRPIEINGETLRAQLLAQRVRPFILRRRKAEVATELPPRIDIVKRVQLQGQQRALYESVRVASDEQVRKVLDWAGFDGAQITILDALLKLRQVCCDPYLLKGAAMSAGMERAKLELLADMLPALVAEGRRVLVFSQFTELLGLVAQELARLHLPWLALTGATPPAERGAVVARFQNREVSLFLLSLKAGGVGLNLTAADTVIHLDPWWNPAVEEQATARAHRIGQTQTVLVYKLVVEGSIEERILALQERKGALAEGVLGSDVALAAKFGMEDLLGLLAPIG
jgi:superfamily II DNA or RNA helicase